MIRNHMMDPEGTPTKAPSVFNPAAAMTPPVAKSGSDDPWYTHSGQDDSPMAGGNAAYSNSYYEQKHSEQSGQYSGGGFDIMKPATEQYADEDYENEPPLLEELGIHFDHIRSKSQAVLYLNKQVASDILDDADLAGPLCFCLMLGASLLLAGKVQFGHIYGFGVFGCVALQVLVNLIHPVGLDFWRTCSVLGYSLLPVIGLAIISIILSLKGFLGLVLSLGVVSWSTLAATRLMDAKLHLTDMYWLVAYPIMLFYCCFVLITIF